MSKENHLPALVIKYGISFGMKMVAIAFYATTLMQWI